MVKAKCKRAYVYAPSHVKKKGKQEYVHTHAYIHTCLYIKKKQKDYKETMNKEQVGRDREGHDTSLGVCFYTDLTLRSMMIFYMFKNEIKSIWMEGGPKTETN